MDPFKPWEPKTRRSAPPGLTVEDARALALRAVVFIAADDDELLPRFVALTGCDLDDMRRRIADDAFLGGVLDFILGFEPTLLAFVAAEGIAAELPALARGKLP